MTKKRNVKDAELENVHGGGGVMDPPDAGIQEVEGNSSANKFDTNQGNVSNDMIDTTGERE